MLLAFATGCTGPPLPIPTEHGPTAQTADTGVAPHWVQVTAQPCALDRYGIVTCWHDEAGQTWGVPPIPSNTKPVTVFAQNSSAHIVGIGLDGMPVDWHCGYPVPTAECITPEIQFSHIGSGCGLDLAGRVVEWDSGTPHRPFGQEVQRLWGIYRAECLTLNDKNLGRIYGHPAVPPITAQFDPGRTYVEIAHYGRSICVLDDHGEVECLGPPSTLYEVLDPPVFSNPPYVDIAGENYAFCAKREDHVLECHDGQTYDFGPIRDFAVDLQGHYTLTTDHSGVQYSGFRPGLEFSICVITENDAIQCTGPRFKPYLLDQLPTGD